MKKVILACLILVSGCAAPVLKEDFDSVAVRQTVPALSFDSAWNRCEAMAKDLKEKFGWSQIPLTQCMYDKGFRLKKGK